jgi:hypothetical protein
MTTIPKGTVIFNDYEEITGDQNYTGLTATPHGSALPTVFDLGMGHHKTTLEVNKCKLDWPVSSSNGGVWTLYARYR